MTREEAIERLTDFEELCECVSEDKEAVQMAIEALEQTRWIPVSSGNLPEENVDVLVVVEFPDWKDETLQRIEIASKASIAESEEV